MYPSYSMNSNSNPNLFPNFIPNKDHTFVHQEPSQHDQDHTFFLHQHIHDLFLHHPPPPAADPQPPPSPSNKARSLKKDRHSKINTAKGPRDRRMRLSLDIARKFFDLQDLLGFDKASKTIEWLLLKSTAAINEVSSNYNHSSTPESYEVVSAMDVVSSPVDGISRQRQKQGLKEKGSKGNSREKNMKTHASFSRKSAYDPMAKESRKAARERAKVRTREKNSTANATIDAKGFGLWSPFETSKDQDQLQAIHEQQAVVDHDPADASSIIFMTYDHHQNLHVGNPNQQRHYGEYGNIVPKTWAGGLNEQHESSMVEWFN